MTPDARATSRRLKRIRMPSMYGSMKSAIRPEKVTIAQCMKDMISSLQK